MSTIKTKRPSKAKPQGLASNALVRKSDVIRLINEYLDHHVNDNEHLKTVLRAIRHDVKHDLPNIAYQPRPTEPL